MNILMYEHTRKSVVVSSYSYCGINGCTGSLKSIFR